MAGRIRLLLILLALPVRAAVLTEIGAPPPAETAVLSVVKVFCPTCERVSDDEDVHLSGANGYWMFGFEDLNAPKSDRDFNDLIVWVVFDFGTIVDWGQAASFTAANPSFGFDGSFVFNAASGVPGVSTAWSNPQLNLDGLDHVVSWRRPSVDVPPPPASPPSDLPGVPEPPASLTLLTGLALAAGFLARSRV